MLEVIFFIVFKKAAHFNQDRQKTFLASKYDVHLDLSQKIIRNKNYFHYKLHKVS